MSDQQRTRRRPRLVAALTAGTLVAVLVGIGTAVEAGLRPAGAPATSASRFVPADGTRGFAPFQVGTDAAPAMVEDALLTGDAIASAVPGAMFARTVPPPNLSTEQTHWWREGVVVSGADQPASRYRVRSVTADGVLLHGQSGGRLGLTFEPALLELPADVRAGRRWESAGRALGYPTDHPLTYRRSSAASTPTDRSDAAARCLQVSSTTDLAPTTGDPATPWTEDQLWCPGLGVVQEHGTLGGTAYALGRTSSDVPANLRAAALEPAADPGDDVGRWTSGTLAADDGDPTFGRRPTTISTSGAVSAVASSGTLHVLTDNGRDVDTLTPLTDGAFLAQGWLHPGAPVTALSAVGDLVLVATADRRLLAYDFGGRLRWATTLPDVAVVAPVASGGRLLVATLDGHVGAYDALTGRRSWEHALGTPVVAAPAVGSGIAAVVDTDAQVHVLDLADGRERWSTGTGGSRNPPVLLGGDVLTWSWGRIDAWDLGTGRRAWERSDFGHVDGVAALGDRAALLLDDQTRAYDEAGTLVWRRGVPASDATRVGTTDVLLEAGALVAVDGAGGDRRRWPVEPDLGPAPRLRTGSGQVWALGHDQEGLTGVWVGDREPGL